MVGTGIYGNHINFDEPLTPISYIKKKSEEESQGVFI